MLLAFLHAHYTTGADHCHDNAPLSVGASVTMAARRMTASGIVVSAFLRRTDIPEQER
jgi:hypothetical protein